MFKRDSDESGRAEIGDVSKPSRLEVTVIRPSANPLLLGLKEFWASRYLIYVFVSRDVRVRYKQTVLGAGWAILQPLLTMFVFTLVFGRLAKVSSGGVPYPIFVLCGLLPWQFVASGLVRSGNSLVENQYLLTRVFVPRLILPVSAVLGGLVDFAIAFFLLVAVMLYYGVTPTLATSAVFPLLLLAVMVALCAGVFFSTLNVRFRDIGHAVPLFTQVWFFLTPIAYPASLIPQRWRPLYELNPMAGVVEGFRWALLGGRRMPALLVVSPAIVVAFLLLLSLIYFQRTEKTFADMV